MEHNDKIETLKTRLLQIVANARFYGTFNDLNFEVALTNLQDILPDEWNEEDNELWSAVFWDLKHKVLEYNKKMEEKDEAFHEMHGTFLQVMDKIQQRKQGEQ